MMLYECFDCEKASNLVSDDATRVLLVRKGLISLKAKSMLRHSGHQLAHRCFVGAGHASGVANSAYSGQRKILPAYFMQPAGSPAR